MFRKSDFERRVFIARACPWSEPVKKITPVDKNGSIMEQVSFVPETCEARSQVQLDPADVNITSLIKNGMRIDPASCLAFLKENGMTVDQIEAHKEKFSEDMYEYLLNHKDELTFKPE